MCAIVGWAGKLKRGQWRAIHELLSELIRASACRGTDATGFAAVDAKRGFVWDKMPLDASTFLATSSTWNRLSYPSSLIAHCRAATHGSPHTGDNRNNHPFVSDHLAVVVNGIAHNYREMAHAYGLPLDSECDSEVVLRLVEVHRNVPIGLHACLEQIGGGMAAAVLDARRRTVSLARNELRPAWMFRLAGVQGWIFCSTREIADEAVTRQFGRAGGRDVIDAAVPLPSGIVVEMSATGRLMTRQRVHESLPGVRRVATLW